MASHQELQVEWMMLDSNCNNWTLEDLQVAAELGRTLLERNEELENDVKTQQAIIDDQAQEIEFLTKQNSTMKEENVTRAKFYEQLEATVFELERTNTTLSRKHDSDRKRIQSLCENIDYLERKCEEMTGTLETIRDENKKQFGAAGKMSRNSYWSSTGSDSSEDDSFIFYKRRSHSLHDLRDYTPSPDEFDTHNSNSPDLKTSETEFIESLETRIEELIASRKKEMDKIHQLEAQMRILLQENANLQEQLNAVQNEKEDVISELRKQLLDTSNYAQQTLQTLTAASRLSSLQHMHHHGRHGEDPAVGSSSQALVSSSESSSSSSSPLSLGSLPDTGIDSSSSTSSRSSSHNNPDDVDSKGGFNPKSPISPSTAFLDDYHLHHLHQHHHHAASTSLNNVLCKRCSAEINLLSLVNSIEMENDEHETLDVGEFSSLEHELARATGNHTLADSFGDKRSSAFANPERSSDIFNWGLRRPSSLLDYLFYGRDEEVGEEACETEVDTNSYSTTASSNTVTTAPTTARHPTAGRRHDTPNNNSNDDDEDACLRKDRESEKHRKDQSNASSSLFINPVKKLKLPVKIPFDEEEVVDGEEATSLEESSSSQLRLRSSNSSGLGSEDAGNPELYCDTNKNPVVLSGDVVTSSSSSSEDPKSRAAASSSKAKKPSTSKQKTGFMGGQDVKKESNNKESAAVRVLPPVSVYLTPASDGEETMDEEEMILAAAAVSSIQEGISTLMKSSSIMKVDDIKEEALQQQQNQQQQQLQQIIPGGNSNVPEYKQILLKMFNLFNNSRRTYPVPVYPFMVQARR